MDSQNTSEDIVDDHAPTVVAEHLVIRDVESGEVLLNQYVVDDINKKPE